MDKDENWDIEIKPTNRLFSLNLKEIWKYRDLLLLFVRRDFVAEYKQTILGPIWYIIQPLFTSFMYYLVLSRMANMATDGVPALLFYIAGQTIWGYFADCFTKTSDTFITNAKLFGKVYFPRLVVPLSVVMSSLIKFGLQFLLFAAFIIFFHFSDSSWSFPVSWNLLLLPIPIILTAGISLGMGVLITSMTTKYRDLKFALKFGVQILMFGSAVIVPFSISPYFKWNPIACVLEIFKTIMLGHTQMDWWLVEYSALFMILILILGTIVFNRTEKNFMDTV